LPRRGKAFVLARTLAAFDSLGNLVVTGDFVNPTFNHDIVTLKLP